MLARCVCLPLCPKGPPKTETCCELRPAPTFGVNRIKAEAALAKKAAYDDASIGREHDVGGGCATDTEDVHNKRLKGRVEPS